MASVTTLFLMVVLAQAFEMPSAQKPGAVTVSLFDRPGMPCNKRKYWAFEVGLLPDGPIWLLVIEADLQDRPVPSIYNGRCKLVRLLLKTIRRKTPDR